MMELIDHVVRTLLEFFLRRHHPGLFILRTGAAIVLATLGFTLLVDVTIPTDNGPARLIVSNESAGWISTAGFVLGTIMIVVGGVWGGWDDFIRRRVYAIEIRGLRDWKGTPLVKSIPAKVVGRREEVVLNLTQGLADGVVIDPARAITKLLTIRDRMDTHEAGKDRNRCTYAGGLAPVPLSFLTGVLLDDEEEITLLDWDRTRKRWRSLDGRDDGARFSVTGLPVGQSAAEVIVAVSGSYPIDFNAVNARVGALPTVHLSLPPGTDGHWSEDKQRALAQEFLNTCIALKGAGVTQIHLFLAAANSVVLRLGMHYDKRNLPPIRVYQYEATRFTWAVEMPVAGRAEPSLVPQPPAAG